MSYPFWTTLILVVFLCVIAYASIENLEELKNEISSDKSIETRGISNEIRKILKKAFKYVTENCLQGAERECKKLWYRPDKLIKCAREVFKAIDWRCLLGDDETIM